MSSGGRAEAAEDASKSELAYRQLQEMITFRDLPPGTMVSEAALGALLGLGRTPVREALHRLERESMVEIHPRRGVLVAEISVEAQLSLLEIRRPLEELTVRLAVARAKPSHLDSMAQLRDRLDDFRGDDVRAFAPLLTTSHACMADAAQNPFLSVAMAPLQGLSRRFWFANMREPESDLRDGAERHSAVLDAITKRDADAAARASLALNDYLVRYARRVIDGRGPS